jgi:hypothetical protein
MHLTLVLIEAVFVLKAGPTALKRARELFGDVLRLLINELIC